MIVPSEENEEGTQLSTANQALRMYSMRRASIDSVEVFNISSPSYQKRLLQSLPLLRFLWRISGIHCYFNHKSFVSVDKNLDGRSSHNSIPYPLIAYRVYCIAITTGYFSHFAMQFYGAGLETTATFLFFILMLVALPGMLLCWFMHDRHNIHLFLMMSIMKRHSPWIFKHITLLLFLINGTIVGSWLYIVVTFQLLDCPERGIVELILETAVFSYLSFMCWVPACFSLVISVCVIMVGHYKECQYLKNKIHNEYLKCVSSGDALYDLHVIFLRVVETSESWSKSIVWCLGSSSICFFSGVITFITDGLVWSVIPPMAVMLPSLWLPALACGSVTARFVRIYISVNTRSPLLLPEADEKNYVQRVLRRGRTGEVTITEDEYRRDQERRKKLNSVELKKYQDEHDKLLELCKHLEDIFGVRVFGMKVTAAQILQLATFYGTGATLIIQNSGKLG